MTMEERSPDRRTARTRKAIRDALAQLLMDRELSKVTVKDITDIADINRGTFYKHYLDIYDLYDKTEQDILVEISDLVLRLQELPTDKFFTELIDYINENRTVFRMIFSPNVKVTLRTKFGKCMTGLFRQVGSEKFDIGFGDTRLRYITEYRTQGCISVISQWVTEGFTEPKEFIVGTITELDRNTEQIFRQSAGKR